MGIGRPLGIGGFTPPMAGPQSYSDYPPGPATPPLNT